MSETVTAINLHVPGELHQQLKVLAGKAGKSLKQYITDVLAVEAHSESKKK